MTLSQRQIGGGASVRLGVFLQQQKGKAMSRMPCSVTDDPLYDRSDWEEGTGYAPRPEPDPDAEYDRLRDEQLMQKLRNKSKETSK